ncbi:protein HEXIM1-like [Glandiceps talaboti]
MLSVEQNVSPTGPRRDDGRVDLHVDFSPQELESPDLEKPRAKRSRMEDAVDEKCGQKQQENVHSNGTSRRRHRRKKGKRKWKPYTEMTWEEKKNLEERESRRAEEKRKDRLTPYNTTQFLMEDHKVNTPDFNTDGKYARQESYDSSDEKFDSDGEGQFFQKDFSETYERLHEENLHTMNKGDLVCELMRLENYVTELEDKLKLQKQKRQRDKEARTAVLENKERTIVEQKKCISCLREENAKLKKENGMLKPT